MKIELNKEKIMKELNELKNELLKEEIFWNIIDTSIKKSEDIDEQEEVLITELEKMSIQEILSFKLRLEDLANAIHTSEMWCAGYLMNGGCSDDGFDYFKNWVISRGKEVYYNAKKNPDTLSDYYTDGDEGEFEFESLDYVAVDAFENKTEEDLYDYMPERTFYRSNFEFNWEEDDKESMKRICPKLFEKVEW